MDELFGSIISSMGGDLSGDHVELNKGDVVVALKYGLTSNNVRTFERVWMLIAWLYYGDMLERKDYSDLEWRIICCVMEYTGMSVFEFNEVCNDYYAVLSHCNSRILKRIKSQAGEANNKYKVFY
jgi:hypothetical protein